MMAPRHVPAFEIQLWLDSGPGVGATAIGAASGEDLVVAAAVQWGLAPSRQ